MQGFKEEIDEVLLNISCHICLRRIGSQSAPNTCNFSLTQEAILYSVTANTSTSEKYETKTHIHTKKKRKCLVLLKKSY